jgi:hypothetical protein
MRTSATALRTSVLALSALSLVACVETTEPVDVIEIRVAHGAPGLGTQTVLMDGAQMFTLPALQAVFFPIQPQPVTYAFVSGADTVARSVPTHGELNAIVLLNADQPTAHHFPMERRLFQVRIMVINGDLTTTEPLTVRIERVGFEFEETIAPGGHAVIEPEAGTYNLSARPAGADAFTALEPFSIVAGDNGFLIVIPDPAPDRDFVRILF